MATRPDIRDFDVDSLLKSFAASKRGSKKDPSYLKRLAPNLIKGVVGIYDQYQTEKLQDEIDQTNFDNTLELAKLNMGAAKKAKMYKETSGQYRDLASKGFNFDNSEISADKISDSNYAIAQRVFGDQAWRETTENFKTIPQELLPSYGDFKKLQNKYVGLQPEAKENIENFYRAAIKDQANYVATGQSFNYDKFQAAAESLQAMDIDFDAADYGLLAKLNGRLRRKIRMRDGSIDTFRSTYMSKPAANMDQALTAWRDSRTKDDLKVNLTMADLGYGAFITPEQLEFTSVFDSGTKEKMRQGMEQFFGDSPDATAKEVQSHFNLLTFGDLNPNQTTITLGLGKLRKLNAISQMNISDEEKQKLNAQEEQRYATALETILERPLADVEQIQSIIHAKEVQTSSKARLDELNTKRAANGQFETEELEAEYQRALTQNDIATVSLQFADMPDNPFTEALTTEELKQRQFDRVKHQGNFIKASFIANPLNYNPNPNVPGNVHYTNNPALVDSLLDEPDEAVRNRAMLGFVAPLKAPPTVSSGEGQTYVTNFSTGLTVSIGNKSFFNLDGVQKAKLTDNDSEKLLNSLGFASQTDQGSNALRRNSPGIIKAAHMSNHLYEATAQNVNIGKMPGVFRGNLPPRSLFENNLPELLISMNAIVRQKDGNFIVDPSLITFEGVKNFYYSKYAQQSPEDVYGKVSVTGGVEFNTLTREQADKALDEVNKRGSSGDQRKVKEIVDNAIIEDPAELKIVKQGFMDFITSKQPEVTNIIEEDRVKKKITPETTSPKETSETNVLDTVINTLVPEAEASPVQEEESESLLSGTSVSRYVDRQREREQDLFGNKGTIKVSLGSKTVEVDTTDPVSFLQDRFRRQRSDPQALTFNEGIVAYYEAIKKHNEGRKSSTYKLDPLYHSILYSMEADGRYSPDRLTQMADGRERSKKRGISLKAKIEGRTKEVERYKTILSDMTDVQKEQEFKKQLEKARKQPIETEEGLINNAIEFLKLQSIFGENDNRDISRRKEEPITVNDKVIQYYNYLDFYEDEDYDKRTKLFRKLAVGLSDGQQPTSLLSQL